MLQRMSRRPLPSLVESLGLLPLGERLRQAAVALRGAEDVPPSRFDLSSLTMLNPRVSLPLWAGRPLLPRTVLLTNLFNHRQTPVEQGWSVQRTQAEDFRGRKLTYDSHNGTDLSVPRGTLAVAPAPGRVARVYAEYNRGGNKVIIDHGEGLITCSAHLARPLVREGQRLALGQPYALTGYSGLDGLISFPWGVPHIHFNVWLNGVPVDPFARGGHASLWVGGAPRPVSPDDVEPEAGETEYDPDRLAEAVARCKTPSVRAWLERIPTEQLGSILVSECCYYPTRFRVREGLLRCQYPRRPRLHLPFCTADFDGVAFLDEIPLRGLILPRE